MADASQPSTEKRHHSTPGSPPAAPDLGLDAGILPAARRAPSDEGRRDMPPIPAGIEELAPKGSALAVQTLSPRRNPEESCVRTTAPAQAPVSKGPYSKLKAAVQTASSAALFSLSSTFAQAAKGAEGASQRMPETSLVNAGWYGTVRNIVSTICLLPVAWKSLPKVKTGDVVTGALSGITNTFFVLGSLWTTPSHLTALYFAHPVMLSAHAWLRGERPGGGQLASTALTVAAVGLLLGAAPSPGPMGIWGNLAALGAAAAWAGYLIRVRRCSAAATPALGFIGAAVAAATSVAVVPFFPGGLGPNLLHGCAAAALNGVCAAVGLQLITRGARVLEPYKVGLLNLIQIPVSIAVPFFIFGTPIPKSAAVAAGITAIAAFIELGTLRKDSSKPQTRDAASVHLL